MASASRLRKNGTPDYLVGRTREVWITLDDGPHPKNTVKIMDVLKNKGVNAVFFAIGSVAKGKLKILERAIDEGHRIGNHTYTHPKLTDLTETQIKSEITKTEKVLGDLLGKDKIFRPPYGAHNGKVDKIVADLGYRNIMWNVDTLDWKKSYQPDKWVQHGIDQIRGRDSSLVLTHDIHKTTADNYDTFLTRISGLGTIKWGDPFKL